VQFVKVTDVDVAVNGEGQLKDMLLVPSKLVHEKGAVKVTNMPLTKLYGVSSIDFPAEDRETTIVLFDDRSVMVDDMLAVS
jgi:hypothetical protein